MSTASNALRVEKSSVHPRVMVLYYSMYGHVECMAHAVADGACSVADTTVFIKRVPELLPPDVARKAGAKVEQDAPIASPVELTEYDAIIFGTPTRFGNMAAQMRNFLDQTGGLWYRQALVGKVESVFVATATGSGNETTITSFHTTLLHHGMIVVGLPITASGLQDVSVPKGGSLLGAGSFAGADGQRWPSRLELELAHHQGAHVAFITSLMCRGRAHCQPESAV